MPVTRQFSDALYVDHLSQLKSEMGFTRRRCELLTSDVGGVPFQVTRAHIVIVHNLYCMSGAVA